MLLFFVMCTWQGPVGQVGHQGDQGAKGEVGLQGPKGEPGAPGPPGEQVSEIFMLYCMVSIKPNCMSAWCYIFLINTFLCKKIIL